MTRIILIRHIHTTTIFWYYYIFLVYHNFLTLLVQHVSGYCNPSSGTFVKQFTRLRVASQLHFIQPEIHIKILSTQQKKIKNNTHSNKYTTRYSKLDGNHGTCEHIKVGSKVQWSDTKIKYTVEHSAKKQWRVENTTYDENKRSDIYTHHTYHTRIQLTVKFLSKCF
jgi:hypothetical protein